MTNNSGNQMRDKKIRSHALTDVSPLADFERFIHDTHPDWKVIPQPYLLFTKGEDKYVGYRNFLTQEETEKHKPDHPDAILLTPKMLIFELDGKIHDIKTENTYNRNRRYRLNNLKYIAINEEDLKYELGLKKSNRLESWMICAEFERRLEMSAGE